MVEKFVKYSNYIFIFYSMFYIELYIIIDYRNKLFNGTRGGLLNKLIDYV
jgi:hypothetical protein